MSSVSLLPLPKASFLNKNLYTETPTVLSCKILTGAKDHKGIKADLSHLWISHTSEVKWPRHGTGTDLLLKRFQSHVSLEHF